MSIVAAGHPGFSGAAAKFRPSGPGFQDLAATRQTIRECLSAAAGAQHGAHVLDRNRLGGAQRHTGRGLESVPVNPLESEQQAPIIGSWQPVLDGPAKFGMPAAGTQAPETPSAEVAPEFAQIAQ